MCLVQEKIKEENNDKLTGYTIYDKVKKNVYRAWCFNYPSHNISIAWMEFEKGKEYEAKLLGPLNYYGFHGFYSLKAAKQFFENVNSALHLYTTDPVILKCTFRSILAEGMQEYTMNSGNPNNSYVYNNSHIYSFLGDSNKLPAFRARYRTIKKEMPSSLI